VIQNLCLDKGYDDPAGEAASTAAGYVPHIRRIGEEKLDGWGEKSTPPGVGYRRLHRLNHADRVSE
jgi:hypothetical protein